MSPQAQAELCDQLEEGYRILAAFNQELEPDMLAWKTCLDIQARLMSRRTGARAFDELCG